MTAAELFADPPTPGVSTAWTLATLAAPVSTTPAAGTVETWTVSQSPTNLSGSGRFRFIIDSEVCIDVTGGPGTSRQIWRGAEGSTPATHASGSGLYHTVTAQALAGALGQVHWGAAYGVQADGKTVADAGITAGTNTLSSASAAFTSLDVGKLACVPMAGTPVTSTSTAALTSGVGFTAVAVNALSAAIRPGSVRISSGANTQWFVTTGAPAGATSIPLIGGTAWTALGAGLSTGAAITSIPVPALKYAIPSGTITLVYIGTGGSFNTQTFSTTGAAVGATAIPVTSATPNFAYPAGTQVFGSPAAVSANFSYPIGSTVSSQIPALFGYIGSVAAGVASLVTTQGGSTALNAGTTVTAGEAFYATDDSANAQRCINDADTAGGTAIFPYGHIGLSATLTSDQPCTIEGLGVEELYGGTDPYNTADFPTIAPYLTGTVFVMAAPDTDVFQLQHLGRSVHLKKFGIRFAGKFVNTGHGINRTPSLAQLGVIGGVLEDVRVFGHDGNHYADIMDSQELCRCVGFRSYGGGGMWLRTNALTGIGGPPGNATIVDQYSFTLVGGVAHDFLIDASAAQYLDYCVFVNPEHIVSAPNPAIANTAPPTSAQQCIQTYYSAGQATMLAMQFVNPVCESNLTPLSQSTFPAGPSCWRSCDPALSPIGNPALTTAPASGSAYQNLMGTLKNSIHTFTLAPAAAATATGTLASAAGAGGTTLSVTVTAGTFAVGQGVQIDTGVNMEFGIISAVSGAGPVTITLVESSGWGLSIGHALGATVSAGAAVVIGQNSSNGSFPGSQKLVWEAAAIGSSPQVTTKTLPVPSGWWYRLDYSSATVQRMWTEYESATG